MKHKYRRIFALLLVLCLSVVMLSVSAFAAEGASTLTIKDLHGDFQVSPGSQESQSDLFSSFKGVMPGDVCVETIEIRNETGEKKPLRLYLTSVSPVTDLPDSEQRAAVEELLSMLSVRVWVEDALVFDAAADASSNASIPVGVIPYRGSAKMRVELTVPVAVNNEQAQNIGKIKWVFHVEDASDPSAPSGGIPQTGEEGHLAFLTFAAVLSFAAVGGLTLLKKRGSVS